MSRAASASVVSGVTQVGFLDMMSCAFIAPPGFRFESGVEGARAAPTIGNRESKDGRRRIADGCALLLRVCELLLLSQRAQ